LDRIIRLYEAWEKPDKAAEWRDKRDRVQAQVFLGLCPQAMATARQVGAYWLRGDEPLTANGARPRRQEEASPATSFSTRTVGWTVR
jgi:hypothetical protein